MTSGEDESLREGREVLERHNPPRDEEEASDFKAMGQAVTDLREWRGMTREELAPKCEITVPELERVENGKVHERWGDLFRITEGLEIPLATLMRKFNELEPGPGRAPRDDPGADRKPRRPWAGS
jgi:transcriptional regulator with XRE-family HTH domain